MNGPGSKDTRPVLHCRRPALVVKPCGCSSAARALFDESDAEPLYRRALALGLAEPYRAQSVIQLASTLRNLGRAEESVALLREVLAEHPDHELADAARAFLALALVSRGDAVAGASVALAALAPHLPRYRRAVEGYAAEL